MSTAELVEKALELPKSERADIITTLIDTLEDENEVWEQELVRESRFINEEIEKGNIKELSEEDFYAGISKSR
jgi:hypothetical protein